MGLLENLSQHELMNKKRMVGCMHSRIYWPKLYISLRAFGAQAHHTHGARQTHGAHQPTETTRAIRSTRAMRSTRDMRSTRAMRSSRATGASRDV